MKDWFIRNREGLAIGACISLAVGIFIASIVLLPNAEEKRVNITEPQYRLYCNAGAYHSSNGVEGTSRRTLVKDLKDWYTLGDGFKVFYMDDSSEWFAGGNQCSIWKIK